MINDYIEVFFGNNEDAHNSFQTWRKDHKDGYHMTLSEHGEYMIHYTQDKRENMHGRGCTHQGGSDNEYSEDGCYTTNMKICANDINSLIAYAYVNKLKYRYCKHCNTKRFPFSVSELNEFGIEELSYQIKHREGIKTVTITNRYERDLVARDKCIKKHGLNCCICNINFESVYGKLGEGFIHVHHLKPLYIYGESETDPEKDLIPVCPNCHAMLHRKKNSVLLPEELIQIMKKT